MKRINLDRPGGPSQLTVMAVGDSRAGKTHFGGTWPRPVFLADASEHGWTTLQYQDHAERYEEDHLPSVALPAFSDSSCDK